MNFRSKSLTGSNLLRNITYLFLSITLATLIIRFLAENVNIEGNSMMPTIYNKDKIIVDKLSYKFRDPEIGDIVIFKYPADTRKRVIKRVVALEGNRIKIENNKLIVDDKYYEESYLLEPMMHDYREITVPLDTVFVLGDNRNNSIDSRSSDIGCISKNLIVGKALYRIYPFKLAGRLK